MTFYQYAKTKGTTLRPWQNRAACAFLQHFKLKQRSGTGKTTLMRMLSDYIDEHGNSIEL